MKRHLVIDGQIFQTLAWHRGMGKYSLELLKATLGLGEAKGWQSMEIILSNHLPEESSMLRELQQKLPKARITYLGLKPNDVGNGDIVEHNRLLVNSHLNAHKTNDSKTDFLVLSLMQGEIYPSFPSDESITKLLLFYDLIPLMFHDIYLRNPLTRTEYLSKISELLRADKYLTISKTVANDLALYLGIDRDRITSIDGGPIDHSKQHKPLAIPKPFILMPTGNDLRKNNRRAILGFEEFNQRYNYKYTLVITSSFKDFEVAEYSSLSQKVVFTGNVTGEELSYLYDESELLLFPPEYEGLGLPILEALERNKPVACSNISVFREMSGNAFNYFNPYSIVEIRDALEKAIDQKPTDTQVYKEILSRYTWNKSAEKMLEAVSHEAGPEDATKPHPRIVVFGPEPSKTNRVGKLMQSCHAELSRYYELDYFVELSKLKVEPRINYLPYISRYRAIEKGFAFQAEAYSAVVYHIGNTEEFANTLLTALAVPGIVVLHDLSLESLWQAAVDEKLIDPSRYMLEEEIEKSIKLENTKGAKYLTSLLANQKAVIVFDSAAKHAVEQIAKRVNPGLVVSQARYPVNSLVYSSILPEKTIQYRWATVETPSNVVDYHDNEELSRTKVIVGEDRTILSMLEAMNFGAVPCLPKQMSGEIVPKGSAVDFKKLKKSGIKPEQLAEDAEYALYSQEIMNYTQAQHTQKAFAVAMHQVVERVGSKEAKG